LLQPLFHGGELEARRRACVAAYDQADAQYRQTVLAFQNVADALRAWRLMRVSSVEPAPPSWHANAGLTRRRYQLGGTGILALFIAQQYQRNASTWSPRIAALRRHGGVVQALGGWWNAARKPRPAPGEINNCAVSVASSRTGK
jgi:outer membrane protein TolC